MKDGFAGAIINLGREMNGPWYNWSERRCPRAEPGCYILAWRHAVDAMRSVPGQHFRFLWTVYPGTAAAIDAWPGAAYVDLVGTDIAWSYELLDSAERALFRGLSVFAGSWTLADAGSVCVVNGHDTLTMVESLLDKSLIRRLPGDEQTAEFSMLESLREYAAEQLTSHAEAEETRARHADHYAGLAAQFEAALGLAGEQAWLLQVVRHHADLRAALGYCLGGDRDVRALWLASALGWYHYTHGDLDHGQTLVDAVLPSMAGGYDAATMSDDATARAQTGVLIAAGVLAFATGEMGRAQGLLRSALEHSQKHGDGRHTAMACAFLGNVARAGGEWDASADWHRRAEARYREEGSKQGVAWARHDLGMLARDHGDLGSAAELLRASLRDFRQLDYTWAVAWSAWGLGTTLSAQGRLAEAGPLLAEALRIYTDLNDPRGVAQCLDALAHVASERVLYESAARLIGAAAALRERVAARQPDPEQTRTSSVERVLARALGPQDADTLMNAGRTMPLQRAADLALAVASGTAPGDADRSPQVPLTPRERQVAALVASGRTNRQIGRVLGGFPRRPPRSTCNAEMIEQIARFPKLRDHSVFVGNPADVVPDGFGDSLPLIRDWVEQNYQFSGYVTGISPTDHDAIRADLGYRPDEKVCVVTVGGSGVGTDLLRRVAAAFPEAKRLVPELRMILVAGPRIDPAALESHDGLEVHGYVQDLYRHLAACDLAVVQGGLTTTMELTASQRPFIYVPLRHHFEQNFHVRHRLAQYGAGRCVDYEETRPEALAAAIAEEVARPVSYRPVETDGAKRAAALLAELI